MIHIEGMGLLGSMLAHRLVQRGEDFTWNDDDSPYNAWSCCTGLAYPDAATRPGLLAWHRELAQVPEAAVAPYLYAHKHPPHGAKDAIVEDFGQLRMSAVNGVSLNVPAFVRRMREQYADKRVVGAKIHSDTELVQCHTTPDRSGGFLWGWTAKVSLDFKDDRVADIASIHQPAFYGKVHRFNLTYAFPIPGEGLWWAGSALVFQKTPKRVTTARETDYFIDWVGNARSLLGINPTLVGPVYQGWRPKAVQGDSGRAERHPDGSWSLPPMATDGMRNGWTIIDDFLARRDVL